MSPLTLRRSRTPAAGEHSDPTDTAALPPVADGVHQTTSAMAAKVATVGLLTCLALAPVGAAAGGLALARSGESAPAPLSAAPDRSNERAVVGQFAGQVVVTWLTSTQDRPDALLALVKDAQASGLSPVPFTVAAPAVAGIVPVHGDWSVTVAATVTDARRSTARRYFQVPVRYDRGSVTALMLPSPVPPPPAVAGTTSGYRAQVDTTSPLGQTITQFLTAFLTGSGDVSRYVTPGVTLSSLAPPPYTAFRLTEVRAAGSDQPPVAVPGDGTRAQVLALGTAVVSTRQASPVSYALTMTARAGRWEITAIDPAPLQRTTSSAPSTASTPAPAQPGSQPAATPADDVTSVTSTP